MKACKCGKGKVVSIIVYKKVKYEGCANCQIKARSKIFRECMSNCK